MFVEILNYSAQSQCISSLVDLTVMHQKAAEEGNINNNEYISSLFMRCYVEQVLCFKIEKREEHKSVRAITSEIEIRGRGSRQQ